MQAIFLDIESTGLDPYKHKVIEIAFKIVDASSGVSKGAYQAILKLSPEDWAKRDLVSTQINGFTWEQVEHGEEPAEVSQEIIDLFQSCGIIRGEAVFICQNPSFDRPFFMQLIDTYTQEKMNWPYHWLDLASMHWAVSSLQRTEKKELFPKSMNLSKNMIAKTYSLPPELEPHKAMNGVNHLISCYQAVLKTNWS